MAGEKLFLGLVESAAKQSEGTAAHFLADLGLAGAASETELNFAQLVANSAKVNFARPGSGSTKRALDATIYAHERVQLRSEEAVFMHENTMSPALTEPLKPNTPFKVLTAEGLSPSAASVKWSLPELQADGTWKAGDWLHVEQTAQDAYRPGGIPWLQTRRALHVSNVPGQWSLGHTSVRVFEAEIGGRDLELWQALSKDGVGLRGANSSSFLGSPRTTFPEPFDANGISTSLRDFPATAVRLKREIFGEQLREILRK